MCVALLTILAVSSISTINVLWPMERLSSAPTLVNIRSTMQIHAFWAGTNDPICAIKTVRATCLNTVDLPAILGPVIKRIWFSVLSISMEFGTYRSPLISFSTTGCRPSSMEMVSCSLMTGFVYPFSDAARASPWSASTWAMKSAVLRIREAFEITMSLIKLKILYSRALRLSWAFNMVDSTCFISSVMNLSAFTRVCFLI